jgi:hypothetical protein
LKFFLKQIEGIPSTISNQEWKNAIVRLKEKATGAELKGFVDQIKHCSARRSIDENAEVCLKIEDLETGLRTSRHLFRTIAAVQVREEELEEWEDERDDEEEWVVQ